ncbi:hypothetical protein PENARI_c032G04973 [Penicillium arizonense]|uniref:Heterokaryon incompatibility domain-containing protein n=1 Tax=Penicillium arizonense TaxID=1835702 RepID=A0A1F5L578_PENAI|nr:hypothetical protein PENARI_c032G04973 [Penicillium arizonense]OGE48079.1 hypothetical protein PENARI_c032G04973 [Penicillium arizonense]
MNSLGTIKSVLADSVVSNSALKEAYDFANFIGDRSGRFRDVALNPEQKHKLRRVLNHFLVPTVKPKFVDDEHITPHDDRRVPDDWLAKTDEDLKTPARMIDVDTMNMVTTYNLGLHDQYCIVSHSWKGSEVTYGYFSEAKKFEPKNGSANKESEEPSNDVSRVVNKCKQDIKDLEHKINSALPHVRERSDGKRPEDIATLLQWYTDANGAEWALGSSQKKLHDATASYSSAEREAEYYEGLWNDITNLSDKKPSEKSDVSTENPEMQKVQEAIKTLKKEALDSRTSAETKHKADAKSREDQDSTIKFFDQNRELCYGIEALLVALQHIRSSRKILESIAQAKKLFNAHFPIGGKRYVWLDTCCINKGDSYELTESLALMGDWYENADLCLVHVDTPRDESSWIEEWKHWKDPSYIPVPLNMTSFDQIGAGADEAEKKKYQVEWATRGWTLQELVLSKVTYYVNSHWQNLVRPVEVLGPLYFLRPFVKRYLRHPYVKRFNTAPSEQIATLKELLSPELIQPGMSQEQELTLMLQSLGFVAPRGLQEKLAESQIGKAVLNACRQLPIKLDNLLDKKSIANDASLSGLRYKPDIAGKAESELAETDEPHLSEKISLFNYLLATLINLTDQTILDDRKAIAKFSKIENMTNWVVGDGLGNSSASTSLVTASDRVTTVATDQAYSLMGILGVRFPAFPAEGLPKALARLLDEVVIAYNDVSVFNWSGKHRGSPLHGRSLYPASIDAFVDPVNNPNVKSKAQTSRRILELFRDQRVRQSETASHVNTLLAEMLALSKKLPEQCSVFQQLGDLATKIKETNFDILKDRIGELESIVQKIHDFTPEEADEEIKNQSLAGRLNNTMERVDSFSKNLKFEAPKMEIPKFEVPKMSFGWKKGGSQPTEKAQPSEPATPATPATPTTAAEERQDPYADLKSDIEKVISALSGPAKGQAESAKDKPLDKPQDKQVATTEDANSKDSNTQLKQQEDQRMVCPNPITVSSGGIRGIFDIQRIIVKMVEPDVLRSRIRTAVRGQKIDGWCIISTGLSMTLVAFSCERDVLAQQLDLSEVIETSLKPEEPSKDITEKEPPKEQGILSGLNLEKTPEQVKVGRMINFVQKQNLDGIAGEWVLARFSGVKGAKWFLCLLKLGAGNDLYGRRIPTDAFSFEDAAPEQGLTEYWHQFTMEKKARTCDTLDMYLNRQKLWQAAGHQMDELSKVENPSQGPGKPGFQGDLETAWEIVQNVSLDKVVNLGKMTGQGLGGLGAELWANHLEGRIEKGALKRVPVSLRTPVRDLDRNRKLLPAMFHAGREMHMF